MSGMRGGGLTSQKARDQPAKFDLVFQSWDTAVECAEFSVFSALKTKWTGSVRPPVRDFLSGDLSLMEIRQ